jgi:hypothetical protein
MPALAKKKFARPYLNGKKLYMVVHACHPSDSRKLQTGGLQYSLAWAKKQDPISKITTAKKGWRYGSSSTGIVDDSRA